MPLDKVELSDLGTFPLPAGRVLLRPLVRLTTRRASSRPASTAAAPSSSTSANPRDIKSYGHATWGASEVWDSYCGCRSTTADGRPDRPHKTNLVYSVDLVRGLDVYVVDLPGDGIGATPTPGVTRGSDSPLSLSSVLPAGLVGAAVALALGVRRRSRPRHD